MSTVDTNASSSQQRPEDSVPYYRKFNLQELGVQSDVFLAHMRPIYETLQWDMYDVLRGKLPQPTRQRAIAEFTLERSGSDWDVRKTPAQPYEQTTNHGLYNRTEPRAYPEIDGDTISNPEVLKLQKAVADIVHSVRADATKLRMIFTFLRTVDEEGRSGICALEGAPHIDGMDYIVSALVINRQNLLPETGESSVYTMKKKQLLKTVLQPGEGIFQDDKNLMHHITNIRRDAHSATMRGIRDMLGIDIMILSSDVL